MTIALYLAAFILHGSEQQLSVNAMEVGNYNFLKMKKNNFVFLEFDFDPLCTAANTPTATTPEDVSQSRGRNAEGKESWEWKTPRLRKKTTSTVRIPTHR